MLESNIIIPIGMQCTVADSLKLAHLRNLSFPFDWIISNTNFVYQTIRLLLENNEIDIALEYFFNENSQTKVHWHNNPEHYTSSKTDKGWKYNEIGNVIFAHDNNSLETKEKYKRRLERLKTFLLDNSVKKHFVYCSPSNENAYMSVDGVNFNKNDNLGIEKLYNFLVDFYQNSDIFEIFCFQTYNLGIKNPNIKVYDIEPASNLTWIYDPLSRKLKELLPNDKTL